ncbi:MAG: AMP-binding protein [Ilumatobacteraceae bacterium]
MNLASIIDDHPDDAIALISRNRPTTYGELRGMVARMRGGLASIGVGQGDRVVLLCGNGVPFAATYLATLGLGAVAVPLNPLSPAPEIEPEIAKIGAKVVVIEKVSAATWMNVDRSRVPSVERVVTTDDVAHAPEMDAVSTEELLASEPVDRVDVAPDHLAALIFTSGTAGSPKAAMLTHHNLLTNIEQSLSHEDRLNDSDVIYGVLPLFHIFGMNIVLGLGLYVGATIVLVQRFDPLTAAETIRDREVTIVPGAPTMWTAFAHFDELADNTFATVRRALSGASRLPVTVAERMRDRFGVEIAEGYGLTEASPTVTTQVGNTIKFGSVGRALDGVEIRLISVQCGEALVGDVGEIWVRGENVFPGYYEDAEATAKVLTPDGWLKTGDMAIADDEGYMYIVDRAKDLVIVSGFNVYPAEVEEVLTSHPDVAESGVIGVPHPHTGEAVKAFVVVTAGADVDEETLREYCLDHLARYKCPTKIMFADSLPKNASGKLVRRVLDDALQA